MKCAIGKREREKRAFSYKIFERGHSFDKFSNALPDPYYYKPTDIVLYDLIHKEHLKQTNNGVIRLFRNCYTHKYIGISIFEKDIDEIINGLDQTLHNGKSWYKLGIFDFAFDKELDKYIDYFEICFHNFSSSYATIEMQLSLSESFQNEIGDFIKQEYSRKERHVSKYWKRNKKKSGAVIGYAVGGGSLNEHIKSKLIYEQMEYVKYIFLNQIRKYFPLLLYSKNKKLYGINVFETNLTPDNQLETSVYSSLGIDDRDGFFLSPAERLYVSTSNIPSRDDYKSDMMYIYNPDKVYDYDAYFTPHNKVLSYFTEDYMLDLYRMVILKGLGLYYLDVISLYRNRVNKYTAQLKSQKKLLKMKYAISKEFYDFNKIDQEIPIKKEIAYAKAVLEQNKYVTSSVYYQWNPYSQFTNNPEWMWKQIKDNYEEIESDLQHKIEISADLNAYKREKGNRIITYFQLIIALLTFVLRIFPEKAEVIAEIIRDILQHVIK